MVEQITPIPDEFAVDEIPKRIEIRDESAYVQEENPDEKENIPPIDDKENIPPPPLHVMHRNDQPSAYKTPEQTVNNNESTVLPNDLQKGVDLINALIDSRTTDSDTKKKLIRKIVRHLLRSKDPKDITQMIMSYASDKSNTKISGVSPLDLEESGQSGVEKTGKDTISGISALSSSSSVPSSSSAASARTPVKSERKSRKEKEKPREKEKENPKERENPKAKEIPKEKVEKRNKRESEQVVQPVKDDAKQDEKEKQVEQEEDVNKEREVKEWLLPVTQSEIEKENARKAQIIQPIDTIEKAPSKNIPSERRPSNSLKGSDKSIKNNEILEFLENEKKTHYNWIDQEIEHLKKLKLLLQNINALDSDDSKGNVSEEKINSVYAKHNRNYLTIYENFRRNVKRTSGNGSQADVSSTLIGINAK